ncbi:MAG: gliding motility-associated C-terminal domain-containing protein [Bacteroidales bacterium]|jgi:gliding motility-associated-like protein|nr:gliding motility-associated C-terminal domain-containing protein [Bacteroidales bacterium]
MKCVKNYKAIILLMGVFLGQFLSAHTPPDVSFSENGHIEFVENKNQWNERVRFRSSFFGGDIYFEKNAITYHFLDTNYLKKISKHPLDKPQNEKRFAKNEKIENYVYRIWLENAQNETVVEGLYAQQDYYNYYLGNDPTHWASNVKIYKAVKYSNLYKGIDALFYEQSATYKYEFVLVAEADPTQIKLRCQGYDKLYVKDNILYIKVGKHLTTERNPFAYQVDENGEKIRIECNFVVKKDIITFQLGDYDKKKTLIIDPTLIFSTYTGATDDNWGFTATYDGAGNMYGGGTIHHNYANYSYPTTVGAFQTSFAGGTTDIGIVKYNATGTQRIYATYLGGNKSDVPHSLVVNHNNELFVLATTSSDNFPVTAGAYDVSFNGGVSLTPSNSIAYTHGSDVVISRFNAGGTQLLASTYFGGGFNDGLNQELAINYSDEFRGSIQLDNTGNVYIASSTKSTNLPIIAGAFQPTFGGGGQDGFIAKFSANLQTLLWSSYLGGNGADAIYSIEVDKSNNIYVCGGTKSNNLPTSANAYQTSRADSIDGFIAKISPLGSLLTLTYYGTNYYDQTYLVNLDNDENVYVFGQTDAGSTPYVSNVAWSNGQGQFISKFSNDLTQRIWSTSFGDNNSDIDISPTALMVDVCDNVHVAGWGAPLHAGLSTSGLPITPNAYKSVTDGKDFYFLSITKNSQSLLYASFFGGNQNNNQSGEHVDGGTSRFDKKGVIYQAVCAGCGANSLFPTTAGVVSRTNNSYNCNQATLKLSFDLRGVIADFVPDAYIVCIPDSLHFENRSLVTDDPFANIIYQWDFGDGDTSGVFSPNHAYTQSGVFTVRLIVIDSLSCNISDTMERQIVVLNGSNNTLETKMICNGDMVQIGIADVPNVTYRWTPSAGLTDTTISNPFCKSTVSQLYTLYVISDFCTDTLHQQVNVGTLPIGINSSRNGCMYDTLTLLGNPLGNPPPTYFQWSSNLAFSDTLNTALTSSVLKVVPTTLYSVYYLMRKNTVCQSIDTIVVTTSEIDFYFDSVPPICPGDSIKLTVHETKTNCRTISYQSTPDSILHTDAAGNLWLKPTKSGWVPITGTNEYGCVNFNRIYIYLSEIEVILSTEDVTCYGLHDGKAKVDSVWGGIEPYNFAWTPGNHHSDTAINFPQGTYNLHITDNIGCHFDTSVTINEPQPLIIIFTDTMTFSPCDTFCHGKVRAVISGGNPPYQTKWISGDTTLALDSLCPGDYFIYIVDSKQCKDTGEFIVVDTTQMKVDYEAFSPTCPGSCDGSVRIDVFFANMPCSFIWKTGQLTSYVTGLCPGIYDVTVNDARNCRRRLFPLVSQVDSIHLDSATIVHPYCHKNTNGSITAFFNGGTPPYQYYWNGIRGTNVLQNLTQGTYQLHIIDAHDCEFDTTFFLPPYDTLSINANIVNLPCTEVCIGSIRANVSGGVQPYTYQWSSGENTPNINNLCVGDYDLLVYDSNHCQISLQASITIDSAHFGKPVVAWADTVELYRGLSCWLHGTDYGNDFEHEWSPAEGLSSTTGTDVEAMPIQTIIYTYTVRDKWGCWKSDTVEIIVLDVFCEMPYVFVPTAFSPNGDGLNDILYVRGDLLTKIDFAIFDRWGEKIFTTQDKNIGWDGTYKGKICDPAVYVWYLDATCLGGIHKILKGNVTLIR